MSSKRINNAEATALSEALDKIKKLNLRNCNITDEGIKAIADQLKKLPRKVRKIYSIIASIFFRDVQGVEGSVEVLHIVGAILRFLSMIYIRGVSSLIMISTVI